MSDHETTLRMMARRAEHDLGRDDLGVGERDALTRHRAASIAGADALRRGTCGTCKWGNRVVGPWGDMLMCKNKNAPAYVAGHVSPDDGCIKGYAPTEPTR